MNKMKLIKTKKNKEKKLSGNELKKDNKDKDKDNNFTRIRVHKRDISNLKIKIN